MILLDTHVWIHWVNEDDRLSDSHRAAIGAVADGIGVSIISCWEAAMLVRLGRLVLTLPIGEWMREALARPGVSVQALTPTICVESTTLPGEFHRDPADRFLVASARVHDCPILTSDEKIIRYSHVRTIGPNARLS